MIIRARPKYVINAKNRDGDYQQLRKQKELFFCQGRSALKFLVKEYSVFYNRQPIIWIQSFNCEAVINSCIQAGASIVLVDIKLDDFSMSYDDLRATDEQPDIVMLTHYQGIPNSEYIKISSYCKKKASFSLMIWLKQRTRL